MKTKPAPKPAPKSAPVSAVKFRSNNCVAVHVPDLAKAEAFYGDVLGWKLKDKSRSHLEFATGTFRFFVNKSAKAQSPIFSCNVPNTPAAKKYLRANGCKIVKSSEHAAYFEDPFGFTFDIIDL